ncbi:hypothetical protein [Corynebacterium auriscanis]|uniref:hypothetical protein n=1 Tax=Corynebacterium auriscanis TaxID=99807 RepID=UPI003CEE6158
MKRAMVNAAAFDNAIEDLRAKIQLIEGGGPASTTAVQAGIAEPTSVHVPPWLRDALAGQGFARGAVSQVENCPAALIHCVAAATAQGNCVAIVNYPSLALAAIDAAGGDLERVVFIPDATPHTAAVLGTLAEGMDMILYHPVASDGMDAAGRLAPTYVRPIEARLRKSECALVVCGAQWPGARLHVNWQITGVRGLGKGSGRVKAVELTAKAWGKSQPPRTVHAVIGESWDVVEAGEREVASDKKGDVAERAVSSARYLRRRTAVQSKSSDVAAMPEQVAQ